MAPPITPAPPSRLARALGGAFLFVIAVLATTLVVAFVLELALWAAER